MVSVGVRFYGYVYGPVLGLYFTATVRVRFSVTVLRCRTSM